MYVSNNSLRPRKNNYFQNNSGPQQKYVAAELHQPDWSQVNNITTFTRNDLEYENSNNSQNSSNSNSNQVNFHRALPENGIP